MRRMVDERMEIAELAPMDEDDEIIDPGTLPSADSGDIEAGQRAKPLQPLGQWHETGDERLSGRGGGDRADEADADDMEAGVLSPLAHEAGGAVAPAVAFSCPLDTEEGRAAAWALHAKLTNTVRVRSPTLEQVADAFRAIDGRVFQSGPIENFEELAKARQWNWAQVISLGVVLHPGLTPG